MKIALELLVVFMITSLLLFLFLRAYFTKRKIKTRITQFLLSPQGDAAVIAEEKRPSLWKRSFSSFARLFKNAKVNDRTEKILLETGDKLKPEEYMALRVLVAFGAIIVSALVGAPWFLITLIIVVSFIIPHMIMKLKRKKRLQKASEQLIDILGMMANSMRAGFSFMQAIQLVGKEMPDPLGPEFSRVVHQTALGVPLEVVFEELIQRVPNKELVVVVRAILAQRRSGGNLAELLETMEDTIRGRVRILEELNTLTAQGKMSSWIITLLPVGLGLYLALLNREYFGPMLDHPLGWAMLFIGSISIFIGWLLIQKIIRIEV